MAKQELSLKQQYQRLTQAKAQATRNGQPTPKLDKKIEKMKAMMGSTVQKVPAAKPSANKFVALCRAATLQHNFTISPRLL